MKRFASPIDAVDGRFWSKVDASGECWEWRATVGSNGYGRVYFNGKMRSAVRVAWMLLVGDCPPGLVPDHLCRNRGCVNIAEHIEWVTDEENRRRGFYAGHSVLKTGRCKYGHVFSGENVYWKNGKNGPTRGCVPCHKENVRKWTRARSEALRASGKWRGLDWRKGLSKKNSA